MSMQIKEKVEDDMFNELHKPENALFHQKILVEIVTTLVPILEALREKKLLEWLGMR